MVALRMHLCAQALTVSMHQFAQTLSDSLSTTHPHYSVAQVNVSELGLVTTSGKVVWGKYAQVTNNPELDGCINAVLLV